MLATAGELPGPAEDHKWAYETKWDGSRVLALIDGMSMEDLKANFQGLMGNVVTQYGDDVEEAK
jgi:hypothetical protein